VTVAAGPQQRSLFERVEARAHEFMRTLASTSATFSALRSGTIDREVYAALLVQIFKVESATNSIFHRLPEALEETAYAPPLLTSESTQRSHVQELVLSDLGAIWRCSPEQAYARVSTCAPLPPVAMFLGTFEVLVASYPWTLPCVAIVHDVWASFARVGAAEIARRRLWPEAAEAVRYLSGPITRGEELAAREFLKQVRGGIDEKAVFGATQSALDMLGFLFAHLDAD
jgi:hypothetical protein